MQKAIGAVFACACALFDLVAAAQNSTELMKERGTEQYAAVKAAMQQMQDHVPGSISNIMKGSSEYNVSSCIDASYLVGPEIDQASADLAHLAEQVVTWEGDFRTLGIPRQVWEALMSRYERDNLGSRVSAEAKIERDKQFKKQLAAALNSYRAESGRKMPTFVAGMAGCGAGEIEMHLAMVPPDGQLFLIPVFLYKLCQAQNLDPSDRKSCDRWTEVVNGSAAYVSGSYIYMARWSDGVVRCGPLEFNGRPDPQKTVNITKLQSPECKTAW